MRSKGTIGAGALYGGTSRLVHGAVAGGHFTFVECADWGSAVKLSLMENVLDQ